MSQLGCSLGIFTISSGNVQRTTDNSAFHTLGSNVFKKHTNIEEISVGGQPLTDADDDSIRVDPTSVRLLIHLGLAKLHP